MTKIDAIQSFKPGFCSINIPFLGACLATALSVSGVALSLFLGPYWALVGFALLGVFSILFAISSRLNDFALKKRTQELQSMEKKLNDEREQVEKNAKGLEVSVSNLKEENQRLSQDLANWQEKQDQLEAQRRLLEKNNETLQKELQQVQSSSQTAQEEMRKFSTDVRDIDQQGLGFQKIGSKIEEKQKILQKTIDSLQKDFQSKISQFTSSMQGKTIALDEVVKSFQEQQTVLANHMAHLNQEISNLGDLAALFQEENKKLSEELKTAQKNRELLKQAAAAFILQQEKLRQEREIFEKETAQIQENRNQWEAQTDRLRETHQSLEKALAAAQEKIDQIDQMRIAREKQLSAISQKIIQELGKLKSLDINKT